MFLLATLSVLFSQSVSPGESELWNVIDDKLTVQAAHDHVIDPITSGQWELSGALEVEFTGRVEPHESSSLTVMGPGLGGLRGEFDEVRLPGEWCYELDYDYPRGAVTLRNLRPNRAPAFPRAEGFGKYTMGGRGGRVYEVINLNDAGPGSFREACEAEGPRVVVFRVSGTIALESELKIEHPYITIAGQTAPGDGICVRNYQVRLDTDHVIIRYMRFRPGDEKGIEQDGFGGDGDHIIIDHCSVSWGTDETLSINKASNLTVQWCLVSESLFNSVHKKGNHGYGGLWGGPGGSFHHNVLAHHSSRNPRASGNEDSGLLDFRNNVIYNWGFNSAYGGELWPRNWLNNYYKPGPATRDSVRRRIFVQKDPRGKMYAAGNVVVGFPEVTADNWGKGIDYNPDGQATEATLRVNQEYCVAPVATQDAEEAYASVLESVGASLNCDAVDARIIEEIRTGTARYGTSFDGGGNGIIDSQSEVGGWPELTSEPAPADRDHDGMPDDWEEDSGLDPDDPRDGSEDGDGDGYTNLDDYLDYLAHPEDYVLAFPGAEGYGRFTKGGRGGDVYCVTNLNDAGPGSLREGIDTARGPRTIVFAVSGAIALKSRLAIEGSYLTIAGQTAPGDGITIKDHNIHLKHASHIVLRYLRLRLGDRNKVGDAPDVITVDDCDHIMLDHLSLSWGIDGNQDTRGCRCYTMQWCIMSEALNDSIHPKGPHAMCGSFRAPRSNTTIHHNVFATSRDRHPTIGGGDPEPQWIIDFRNNVIYNWSGAANVCDNRVNLVHNYFRPGPETDPARCPVAMKASLPDKAQGHMSGNVFEDRPDLTADNYAAVDFERWLGPESKYRYAGSVEDWKVDQPYDLGANAPETQPAAEAYERVLERAGASLKRDAVDERLIRSVRERTGELIDSQDEVGGWPDLEHGIAPEDADRDGMPDTWERDHGLNPQNAADRNFDHDGDGHTNLEEYLAYLCR